VEGTDELVVHGNPLSGVKEDPQALHGYVVLLSTPAHGVARFSMPWPLKDAKRVFSVDKQIREFEMLYALELLMVEDDTVSGSWRAK
jgi:hypothetical protein